MALLRDSELLPGRKRRGGPVGRCVRNINASTHQRINIRSGLTGLAGRTQLAPLLSLNIKLLLLQDFYFSYTDFHSVFSSESSQGMCIQLPLDSMLSDLQYDLIDKIPLSESTPSKVERIHWRPRNLAWITQVSWLSSPSLLTKHCLSSLYRCIYLLVFNPSNQSACRWIARFANRAIDVYK